MPWCLCGFVFFCLWLIPERLAAQSSAFEGRTVDSVKIQAEGPLNKITEADIFKLIGIKEGEPYSASKVALSLRRLHSSGVFFDIQVRAAPSGSGVDLTFLLYRKYLIRNLHFAKDPELAERDLRRAVQTREGEPYSEERLQQAVTQLEAYYSANGYYTATIDLEPETDMEKAEVHVDFNINADNQARVGELQFDIEGPTTVAEATKIFDLRAGKRYTDQKTEEGLQRLRDHFALKGFLDADIELKDRALDRRTNRVRLDVQLHLKEPTEILIEGYQLSDEEKLAHMPMYRERSSDPVFLQESADNLAYVLQRKGYFQANVRFTSAEAEENQARKISFQVTAGPRYSLSDIDFEGNSAIPSRELKAALEVQESSLFSRGHFTDSLVRDDAERIRQAYYRRGYLDAKIETELIPRGGDHLDLTFKVDEGLQYRIRRLTISGNRAFSEEHIRALLRSQPSLYYSPAHVTEDRVIIVNLYENEGYRDVQFRSDIEVDAAVREVDIQYSISEGTQYWVEDVIVTGNIVTRQKVIFRELQLEAGKPLALDRSLQSESDLYNLGVFNQVNLQSPSVFFDSAKRTLIVNVEEAKRRTLLYGAGFDTEDGPRGTLGFSSSNFMGMARILGVGLRLGRFLQRGNISYTMPRPLGLRLPTIVTIFAQKELHHDVTAGEDVFRVRGKPFDSFRLTGLIQSEQRLNRRTSLFYRYNFERVTLSNLAGGLTEDDIRREERPIRLSSVSTSFLNDSRDDAIEPTSGTFASGDVTFTTPFLGSQVQFGRVFVQGQYYQRLLEDNLVVFASSLRVGVIQPFGGLKTPLGSSGNPVPISQRFFAGGSTTLRGFRLDAAGPLREAVLTTKEGKKEQAFVPTGGNALLIGNLEIRFPLYRFVRGVVFYDAGNVFSNVSSIRLDKISHTVGFGFRVGTPVGAVRLDVGYNLHPGFELPGLKRNRRNFFFTIGQTF